tara:strand:+ start:47 stop:679 length:633 start_codon:yes stop_codon:yes gene_type:complete
MANTTFQGPVRSEGGFEVITKDTSTGVITTNLDINASGSIISNAGIATATGRVGGTLTAKNQIANGFSGALVKNTVNIAPADGNNATMTLPASASSVAGDVIVVEYHDAMSNGQTHKYTGGGASGEFFMAKSVVYRMTGATGSAVGLIMSADVADGTGDDFLNLIGLTNSGPGIGSIVVFSYNGTQWNAEARLTSSGTGIAANLSVFATT